jgi:hypothetical protein
MAAGVYLSVRDTGVELPLPSVIGLGSPAQKVIIDVEPKTVVPIAARRARRARSTRQCSPRCAW